jgi:predicted phosphodiesterase
MHDADQRLQVFVDEMNKGDVDFIIELGDFMQPQDGYDRYIGRKQLEWLKQDLAGTGSPVIIFSHQSIEDPGGVENAAEVRMILEEANRQSDRKKVIACFSGHHHIDYDTKINGIQYIQVNSMSYVWMGGDYLQVRYSDEIDEQYPFIKYTAPYKDPIFATIEIDSRGIIRITGRESSWVGPVPWELGYPEEERDKTVPGIYSRELEF